MWPKVKECFQAVGAAKTRNDVFYLKSPERW